MLAAGHTDIGKVRTANQDAIFVSAEPVGPLPNLFVVADGMGGHNGGDVASRRAVATFCAYIQKSAAAPDGWLDLLVAAAGEANRIVFRDSIADPALSGMGTTLTACVIGGGKCEVVHIGDSRAYMITADRITQLTNDHSYVNEMVKAGQLTPSQAREHPKRNILTRVLGTGPDMDADGYVRALTPNATILLCSDGLTNMLTDEAIGDAAAADMDITARVRLLIDEANRHGGLDNISVVLIDTTDETGLR